MRLIRFDDEENENESGLICLQVFAVCQIEISLEIRCSKCILAIEVVYEELGVEKYQFLET